MPPLLLRVLVFVSGMAVMAVEMTGMRLVAPFFGTSLIVTTVLIGSLMTFLAVGYSLGGRYGDRSPRLRSLCTVTFAASVLVLLIPFVAQPVLRAAAATMRVAVDSSTTGVSATVVASVVGAVVGTLVLFAAPVVLMGMVSPWAVRLAIGDVEGAGRAAGRLYALSTAGSIVGSFLPALVLIPLLGVRNTFVFVGISLLLVSALGLWGRGKGAAAAGLFVPLLAIPQGTVRPMEGLVEESESLYHFIQVVVEPFGKCEKAYHLYLNEGVGIHSVKCLDASIETRGYWPYMAAAGFYRENPTPDPAVLIVGLAGGTSARQLLEVFPQARIDGVEIDPAVWEAGVRWFDNGDPRITPWLMDGRIFLQSTDRKWDFVVVDAYRQPYIPFHLTTVEFWKVVADHLNDDAVVAINVASVRGKSKDLTRMIYRTMREVFPSVHYVQAALSNDVLVATPRESTPERLLLNLATAPSTLAMDQLKSTLPKKIQPYVEGWRDVRVLTDDQAPVELAWEEGTLEYAR